MAHELGHNFGSGHTFALVGRMSYSTDVPFAQSGTQVGAICSHLSAVLDGSRNCLGLSQARCGNGALEAGEACDDGGAISGDGCSADCTVECGWRCSQPSQLDAVPTTC